jgi:hypothetical protein
MDEDQLYFRPPEAPAPKRQSDTELIMARLARMPTRAELWRAALMGMLGGSALTISLALVFWH